MKKICHLLLLPIFMVFTTFTFAQTITCSDFAITAVNPDTATPNTYQISIQFNAAPIEMVNFQHVYTHLDCSGDTVTTVNMFWFGQLDRQRRTIL